MIKEINDSLMRLKKGETEGFNQAYELTHRCLFAFIVPIIDDYQLAEDILQETYISVYRSIDRYEENTNGLNWMYTIAKNSALNMLAKRSHEEHVDFDSQTERAGSIIMVSNLDTPTIDLAKKILEQDELNILFLYAIGEYKHREIAEILALPIGTVTWKYQQAIKKLRTELTKDKKK